MNQEQIKRYSLLEIALLAILLIGMFGAWLVVKARSGVLLSEAVALDGSGLSVRVPTGAGWESTPVWVYESDHTMRLLAQRRVIRQTEMEVRWRYHFSARPAGLQEILMDRLAGGAAAIEPVTMPEAPLMEAAKISTPGGLGPTTYYVARAKLDHGRAIELQVTPKQAEYDSIYAETLFRKTAASLSYEAPKELADGMTLLNTFMGGVTNKEPEDEAYLIKEDGGRTIGFFHAQYRNDQNALHILNRHYDAQQFMSETELRMGPGAELFEWQSRLTLPLTTGVRLYEIRLEEPRRLRIRSNYENEQTVYVNSLLLPELLMRDYVRYYLDSGQGAVVTDVLAATGALVPVRLRTIPRQESMTQSDRIARTVRVEYLHSQDFFDEFYFDAQGAAIARFERQPHRPDRLWERTDAATLKQLFGERADTAELPAAKEFF